MLTASGAREVHAEAPPLLPPLFLYVFFFWAGLVVRFTEVRRTCSTKPGVLLHRKLKGSETGPRETRPPRWRCTALWRSRATSFPPHINPVVKRLLCREVHLGHEAEKLVGL